MTDSIELLRQYTGVAPFSLLHCPSCGVSAQGYKDNMKYSWGVDLSCTNCSVTWTVCTKCDLVRSHYTNERSITRHHRAHHNKPSKSSDGLCGSHNVADHPFECLQPFNDLYSSPSHCASPLGSLLPSGSEESNDVQHNLCTDEDVGQSSDAVNFQTFVQSLISNNKSFDCGNDISNAYFAFESEQPGSGVKRIIHCGHFRESFIAETATADESHIDDDEAQLHLKLARLVMSLSPTNNKILADVLSKTILVTEKRAANNHSNSHVKKYSSIPTSYNSLRSLYMDGKYSIVKNLPRPKVHMLNNHGYISLRDCVADLLSHGFLLDYIDPNETKKSSAVHYIRESSRAHAISKRSSLIYTSSPALVLYLNEWSDDYEPNKGSKANRGSAWIKTVTISPPVDSIHSLKYTYPIAVGRKGISHEEVEKAFAVELYNLRSGTEKNYFYCANTKSNIPVYLELFASLQDQPERRSCNYIMLGNSTYSARWGYAIDLAAVSSGVPCCRECFNFFKIHATDQTPIPRCENCVQWSTHCLDGRLDFVPPKDYPLDELPLGSGSKLTPLRITYEILINAVNVSHIKVVNGEWSLKNAKSFMSVHGLNTECIEAVLLCAKKCRLLHLVRTGTITDATVIDSLNRDVVRQPNLYQQWIPPSIWTRGTDLHQSIDVIMHLLFLGVVKTVVIRIEDWLKLRGKAEAFLLNARQYMSGICNLQLSWCKVIAFSGGKMAGWVSENYLALLRIFPWFYSDLSCVVVEVPYSAPEKPQQKWTSKENRQWLTAHGVPTAKLKAKELQLLVQNKMLESSPVLVGEIGGNVASVLSMVNSLYNMTSEVMNRIATPESIDLMRRKIIHFLSCYDAFDSNMRASSASDKSPGWISSYNFSCLVNLPDTVAEFGPMRNLWEGGGQGEKILRIMKKHMQGFRKNWQHSLLNNVLSDISLTRLQENADTLFGDSDKMTRDHVSLAVHNPSGEFKVYKNEFIARRSFVSGLPISAVEVVSYGLCIVVKGNTLIPMTYEPHQELKCNGLSYLNFRLQHDTIIVSPDEVILRSALLLPRLVNGKMPTIALNTIGLYCVIDNNWNTLTPEHEWISHIIFN